MKNLRIFGTKGSGKTSLVTGVLANENTLDPDSTINNMKVSFNGPPRFSKPGKIAPGNIYYVICCDVTGGEKELNYVKQVLSDGVPAHIKPKQILLVATKTDDSNKNINNTDIQKIANENRIQCIFTSVKINNNKPIEDIVNYFQPKNSALQNTSKNEQGRQKNFIFYA